MLSSASKVGRVQSLGSRLKLQAAVIPKLEPVTGLVPASCTASCLPLCDSMR